MGVCPLLAQDRDSKGRRRQKEKPRLNTRREEWHETSITRCVLGVRLLSVGLLFSMRCNDLDENRAATESRQCATPTKSKILTKALILVNFIVHVQRNGRTGFYTGPAGKRGAALCLAPAPLQRSPGKTWPGSERWLVPPLEPPDPAPTSADQREKNNHSVPVLHRK